MMFKQLIQSIYSPKSIAEWRNQKIGRTVLFLLLLTALSIVPSAIFLTNMLNGSVSELKEQSAHLPPFTIENGLLTTDFSEPFIKEGDITIIFDPEEQLTPKEIDRYPDHITFLKNYVSIKAGPTYETFDYSVLGDLIVTKESMLEFLDFLDSLLTIVIPIMILIMYLFVGALTFLQVVILAWVGIIFNKGKRQLTYKQLWVMSAYSIVLPTLFFIIMDLLQTTVPYGMFVNWGVALIVLILATREIPEEKTL